MSEEEVKQEDKKPDKEDPKDDTDKGDKPAAMDKVERAEKAVKSYEEFEKRIDEKITKLEDLKAESILGGTADAGSITTKKVLTDTEYAEALQKGEVNPMKEDGLI